MCNVDELDFEIMFEDKSKLQFSLLIDYNTDFDYLINYIENNYPEYNVCHKDDILYLNDVVQKTEKIYLYKDKNNKVKLTILQNINCPCKNDKSLEENNNNSFLNKKRNMKVDENINNELKKKIEELEKENKKLKDENTKLNNIIQINPNNNQIVLSNNKSKENISYIDFYDVIIDIKSIKDIKKGWEIKMNERGKQKYKEHKEMKVIKIGVIGNSNKGKSFLLSKISKIELPSGTSIRTEGLSVKYPELEEFSNRKIVLLDSAGLETPVLKDNEYDEIINNKKDNINNNIENLSQSENVKKDLKEYFKEKSREKLITELFLQNYIIHYSDILILVVGIFTYSEQKLLNRIKTEIEREKIKKNLYIIHNLMTYTSITQVTEYINEFLLKSATFDLELGHKVSTLIPQQNGIYYEEKDSDPKIFHLIYANENSEAGNYFNEFTLNYIEHTYQSITGLKNFDVIETVKERFLEKSKEIIDDLKNLPLKFDDKENEKYIKLNTSENIILKKCLIDELGFSNLKGNGFEPKYNCYKINDNILKIVLECPGFCDLYPEYYGDDGYKIIKLSGVKYKDENPENFEDNIFNTREFGKFSLEIPFKNEDYLISDEQPEIKKDEGIFYISIKLNKKKKFEPYIHNNNNKNKEIEDN